MPTPRILSNTSAPLSSVNTHHSSLRNQLYNILPKHALFKVKVTIHQLSNVPFLGGQYGVKWRFRNVQSVGPNVGLLAKMKASKSASHLDASTTKAKGRELSPDTEPLSAVEDHREGHGIYINGFRNDTTSSDYLTSGFRKSSASSPEGSADSSPLNTTSSVEASYSDGRGITEWAPLHEHSSKWEHTVNVVVRMDVDRETLNLLHNEMKLTIMQVRLLNCEELSEC